MVSSLACVSTAASPLTDGTASPAEDRAFTLRVVGLDGARALETRDASGMVCDHCGGGPTIEFGGALRSSEGEAIRLSIGLEGVCSRARSFRFGLGYPHHASLRRGDDRGDEAEPANGGRVWVRCRESDAFLRARLRLRFPSGSIRGRAWGDVRISAGYE